MCGHLAHWETRKSQSVFNDQKPLGMDVLGENVLTLKTSPKMTRLLLLYWRVKKKGTKIEVK